MLTHTKLTQWLSTTEAQDNPWRGTLTPRNKILIPQMTISIRTLMILRAWKMKTTTN